MPLGTKVGLDPSDIVIDGDPGPPPKRDTAPPHFLAHALWPNGSMNQDATWYGCRPRPRPHCVMWDPVTQLPPKGHSSPSPTFRPMSVCGQMVDHLSKCSSDLAPSLFLQSVFTCSIVLKQHSTIALEVWKNSKDRKHINDTRTD